MRYSRVLTVLALIGVVGLTATLVSRGGRAAPRPARAAVTTPVRPAPPVTTLRGALQQQLEALTNHRSPGPRTPPLTQTLPPSVLAAPATCPVASGSCSGNPCVYFVQSGSQAVAESVQSITAAPTPLGKLTPTLPRTFSPTVPGGPGSQNCTRRALPRAFRVSSAVAQPAQALSVSSPEPRSRGGS